ncbi:MAG: GUN4 domain-containing protein, partial [Dolichospermum sp.]
TSLTVGIGTPGYMPSEQANGKPKFASDVYAVGIIGIQAVTGLLPAQLQEDSITGEIIWRNHAQVSDRFAEVINNMVRDHFSQRYKNANEALQVLNAIDNKNDFSTKILAGFGVAIAVSFASGYAMNNLFSNQGDPKVAATSQPVQPVVKPKNPPKVTSTPQPVVKITTNKAAFRNLDKLLATGKWKEADIETYKVMLKIAGRQKEGNLDFNSIKNFSCSSMQDIDKRWVKASNGRFGFSIQKQIWTDIASTVGYNSDDFNKFSDQVGWRTKNNWLRYSDLTFNINAPRGHLPNTPPEYGSVTGFRRMIPLISPCKL